MAVLEAPAPPKKGKGAGKGVKKVTKAVVAEPVVVAEPEVVVADAVVESVEPELVEGDIQPNNSLIVGDEEAEDELRNIAGRMGGYIPFLKWVKDTMEKSKKEKNDNSPDIENGVHMRVLDSVKTKMRYIFPYKADGGKSLIKEMKDNTPVYGVSCNQKNNSKDSCKVANYKMIWLNKTTVKDTITGQVYPHHDGKFSVVVGETAFNVRMMVLA